MNMRVAPIQRLADAANKGYDLKRREENKVN